LDLTLLLLSQGMQFKARKNLVVLRPVNFSFSLNVFLLFLSSVEMLSEDMTLREQGFHGDIIVGLIRKDPPVTDEYALYVKV